MFVSTAPALRVSSILVLAGKSHGSEEKPCSPATRRGLTVIHSSPQANLYPTVGLQTPGEIVDANFGQQPFLFDIEDYMREWRAKVQGTVHGFPISARLGEWQAVLQK